MNVYSIVLVSLVDHISCCAGQEANTTQYFPQSQSYDYIKLSPAPFKNFSLTRRPFLCVN